MLTLEEFTASRLSAVPTDKEITYRFTPKNCPTAPAELETSQLLIETRPLGRQYGASVWRDVVWFFGEKPTLRSLGLLIFSHVFHPGGETVLHLRHPETEATKLVIRCTHPCFESLRMTPIAHEYSPQVPEHEHPLYHGRRRTFVEPIEVLPCVVLTNDDNSVNRPDDKRNVVVGFGSAEGSALIAELLLDIGLPQNDEDVFRLEAAPGYQSVNHFSAEVRFLVGFRPQQWGYKNTIEAT